MKNNDYMLDFLKVVLLFREVVLKNIGSDFTLVDNLGTRINEFINHPQLFGETTKLPQFC